MSIVHDIDIDFDSFIYNMHIDIIDSTKGTNIIIYLPIAILKIHRNYLVSVALILPP